jgi:hypothetical protein
MVYTFETEFNIGDIVYHKLPETPAGMVTEIGFTSTTMSITYYVTFDPQAGEVKCYGWELSKTQTF